MKPPIKRCAIYTRKSSEEGLEQEFNSLDAQRESCLAYIISQKSEGWSAVKTLYDDGGFSGGNMQRPALKQLIEDIKAKKIDTIVVYKIDRLTRSLMDFSKLVEVFDEYGVTFVSVTQSFNTTTSMGRLTLNVLLSFAQFEREVTGERIRDKIAASKKKGMWMGGNIPLGYDVENRHLLVNQKESEIVRLIYNKYLELGSVSLLKTYLDKNEIKSKIFLTEDKIRGGRPHSRGNLYVTLTNPLYIGKIKHKGEIYEGQHQGIVDMDIWEQVQQKLQSQSVKPRKASYIRSEQLLSGKLFDCEGNRYTPSFTNKKDKRHHYYVSQNLLQPCNHPNNVIARLPADQTNKVIKKAVYECLTDAAKIKSIFELDNSNETTEFLKSNFDESWTSKIIKNVISKIVVYPDTISLHFKKSELSILLAAKLRIDLPISEDEIYIETIPFYTRRGDCVMIVSTPATGKPDPFERTPTELKNWVRGIVWRDEFFAGTMIGEIAKREKISASYVGRLIDASLEVPGP